MGLRGQEDMHACIFDVHVYHLYAAYNLSGRSSSKITLQRDISVSRVFTAMSVVWNKKAPLQEGL